MKAEQLGRAAPPERRCWTCRGCDTAGGTKGEGQGEGTGEHSRLCKLTEQKRGTKEPANERILYEAVLPQNSSKIQ